MIPIKYVIRKYYHAKDKSSYGDSYSEEFKQSNNARVSIETIS